jgi:hypothetical protein
MWHKRHALQLAAQLPDDPDDALLVLQYARQLVEGFLVERHTQEGTVVRFGPRPEPQ